MVADIVPDVGPQYVLSPFCQIYAVPDVIPDMYCPQFIVHGDNADTTNERQQKPLVDDMGMTWEASG